MINLKTINHKNILLLIIPLLFIFISKETFGSTDEINPICANKTCEIQTTICVNGSSVILANGTYEFSETDLTVPAPAMPVEWTDKERF